MLAHTTRGSGSKPVLLLHGFLGSGRNLGALTRAWIDRDEGLTLVQADLLGHGRSPALPEGADLDAMAEAALALGTELGWSTFDVVGHSLGGRVALCMRALAPDRVRRATLLDIAPGPTQGLPSSDIAQILLAAPARTETREEMFDALRSRGLIKGLVDWLLMNLDRTDEGFVWRIDRAALVEFHQRNGARDLWPEADAHAEVLACLRGGASKYVSDEDEARYRALGVRFDTVVDAGHFIHVDATPAVVDHLVAIHPSPSSAG